VEAAVKCADRNPRLIDKPPALSTTYCAGKACLISTPASLRRSLVLHLQIQGNEEIAVKLGNTGSGQQEALSSTFALARPVRHQPSVRTNDLLRGIRRAGQVFCIRTTATQTVQPTCPQAY
jgi:hypothetical protein